MKRRFWNISIALLYGVLIVLMIQLYFTAELRHSYAQALNSAEEQLRTELKNEVAYLNSQVPYLSYYQDHRKLRVKYCESIHCIDTLEQQFQEKLEDFDIVKTGSKSFLYSNEFNHWNELRALTRLWPLVHHYIDGVMGHSDLTFFNVRWIKGVFSEPFVGYEAYYHPGICNNLLSINDGPYIKCKPSTPLWFNIPHSDTLKLTYFKDNYSYGYGRDSIIKRYVYDISNL